MIPEQFIWIGVIVALISYFFYFKDMFYGETKPNLVSWFFWTLGPLIGVFFQLKAGAGLSVLPIFMGGFMPLTVVIVSILNKKVYWKINAFDLVCGIFSLFAILLYIATHNLAISIIFAILSDAFAFIPTYIKAWKFPHTETSAIYFASIFNNILALLIIKNWTFVIYSFGVYLIIGNLILITILYRKKIINMIYSRND